ncbi:30S ribosomal protein S6 [Mesoplasma photuris]|uniref:30S ribosomal protein S6 n=1 Tax=Mesoplasma photuris TaxID=217731 RepID=UPI000A074F10|nr:30S ribosomal protein S6 [Mesoplasma photuris]
MIRKYEIMFIIDQDVQNVKETSDKLVNILAEGGKVLEIADWGLMDFAYEINHKKKGHYSVVIVETTSEAVAEMERIAGIDKAVVRTLVLNTENVQDYIQSTVLSKTDMTKFEEERRERRNFKKPFNKNFNNNAEHAPKAASAKTSSVK